MRNEKLILVNEMLNELFNSGLVDEEILDNVKFMKNELFNSGLVDEEILDDFLEGFEEFEGDDIVDFIIYLYKLNFNLKEEE